eukprot:SAG31_NODE_3251_length_4490_cov_2.556821_7_plen_150_part_00
MAGMKHMQDYTLHELFKQVDSDNSGTIGVVELRQVLEAEGVNLTLADAASLMGRVDSIEAADLELDFEEFKKVMVGSAADMSAVVDRFARTLRVMRDERRAPADRHPVTNGWQARARFEPYVLDRFSHVGCCCLVYASGSWQAVGQWPR